MNIEDVFSSKLRIKIIRIIEQIGEVNVSELARRLGANYETTSKHLKILEDEGILNHKIFGRIRLYRINENSAKAKALRSLLGVWEHTNK